MLVSIIVPVYKAERYLKDCLNSILAQSHTDIELIMVDDGSSDSSGEICEKYVTMDERVKVIHTINRGVSAARNAGLDIASGEYILFCDSDDFVSRFWVEKLVGKLELTGCDLSVCYYHNFEGVYTNCVSVNSENYNNCCSLTTVKSIWSLMEEHLLFMLCNKAYRRNIIEKYNIRMPENWQYGEDFNFFLNYASKITKPSSKITLVNEELYFYRRDTTHSLTKTTDPNLWEHTNVNFELFESILKQDNNSFREIQASFYTTWIWEICMNINNYRAIGDWKTVRNILKSGKFKTAFQYGNAKKAGVSTLYEIVLRLRSVLALRLVFLLSHYKNMKGIKH